LRFNGAVELPFIRHSASFHQFPSRTGGGFRKKPDGEQAMIKNAARVFLVDDHPLVREWLTNLIAQSADLAVCGEAAGTTKALQGIRETKPDIAIVDLSLSEGSGLDLIKNIRAQAPAVGIVVLSMHDERFYSQRVFRAGARGYVMKGEATGNIAAAIREVLGGKKYLSRQMRELFAERFVDGDPLTARSPIEELSDRELEVFRLLGQGNETRRVALSLNISIKTVQAYCARIKQKLGLANASELLREAVRWSDEQAGSHLPRASQDGVAERDYAFSD
jgi:DNA-binding NarL/FixJ family response regulator